MSEETAVRPKPMVEVGGMPILWHILKIYSHYGLNDFIICLGYKGDYIKEYFANYCLRRSDVVFDLVNNTMELKSPRVDPWRITCIDTGADSMTGGVLGECGICSMVRSVLRTAMAWAISTSRQQSTSTGNTDGSRR